MRDAFNPSLVYAFEEGGGFYLFDGESLGLARVGEEVHALFRSTPPLGRNKKLSLKGVSHQARQSLEQLRNGGFGMTCERDEPKAFPGGRGNVGEVYIGLAEDCNLACTYCYSDKVGTPKSLRFMKPDVADKAVEWIFDGHAPGDHVSIVLWGGEPFLNWKVFERVVTQSRAKAAQKEIYVRFATTTNGTLLTPERFSFLATNRVSLNVSIDGAQGAHDSQRPFKAGRGSFSTIAGRLHECFALRKTQFPNYFPIARATVTHQTVGKLFEAARTLWSMGVPVLAFRPVDYQSDSALDEGDWQILEEQLRQWRELILERLDEGESAELLPQLQNELAAIYNCRRFEGSCYAGIHTIFIDPEGAVHACYNLTGANHPSALGSVEQEALDASAQSYWAGKNAVAWRECVSCPFKYLCGGGCLAKSLFHQESYPKPAAGECRFNQIYQAHRLHLYAAVMCTHREWLVPHLDEFGGSVLCQG